MYLTEQYDYKNVLQFFEQITKIPHGSGNVVAISDYISGFAASTGYKYRRDDANNVVIFVPATKGYEKAPTVMLQGHMDMVCEKNADVEHDFTSDPLKLRIVDGKLCATGTTLGGDDGIAVAYMMAIAADKELEHPALELVFTTDEETGMDGMKALSTDDLKAKYMINLDNEEEGHVIVSCAGGLRQNCVLPVKREKKTGKIFKVTVDGLKGGHSGQEINKNRTNAVYALARYMFELRDKVPFMLSSFAGGKKDNAIPREAYAEIVIPEGAVDAFFMENDKLVEKYTKELAATEPGFLVKLEKMKGSTADVIDRVSFEKLLFFFMQSPNGVQRMSGDIEGLVESSLNLGIFELKEEYADFNFSLRSSVSTYKQFMSDKLEYLISFIGGDSSTHNEYPAWEYKRTSELRDKFAKTYKDVYGKEPLFEAIHAGLECGLISEKMPGLDIISIGPDMQDIHTPGEALGIESSVRLYKLLEKFLSELK